jgi:cell wall-associated NlpC family hydrolase
MEALRIDTWSDRILRACIAEKFQAGTSLRKRILGAVRTLAAAQVLGVVTIAVLGTGCASAPAKEAETVGEVGTIAGDLRSSIALLALSMIGTPYRYGGSDPSDGFDCSGLVYYAYTRHGQTVPRTSRAQFDAANKIPIVQAAAGDLLFFQDQANLSHVGIYLGDGRFVHAPSSGHTVSIARMDDPYYRRHLVAIGSLLP